MTWKFYPVIDLSSGLNLKQAPWLIQDNESVTMENCDLWTRRGSVLGRQLSRKLNATPLVGRIINLYRWVKSDGTSYLIAQTDDGNERRVYYSTDNVIFYLLAVGCNAGYRVNLVDYEDWMYFLDLNNTPTKWDGVHNPTQWGIESPQTAPIVATTGAGLLNGTYTWKVVYLSAQGTRSPNSPVSLPIVLSGGSATLTLPISPDVQVETKEIYRQGGLLTDYYLVDTVANSITSYFDNIADIDLGDLLDPYDRYPAPQAKYGTVHYNRIFVANLPLFPHSFTWSRARRPENFYDYSTDINGQTAADPVGQKGKQIMGVRELGESLFFMKEEGIFALRGGDEQTFYLDNTYVSDGVASDDSICDMGVTLGYQSFDGYYVFNGISSKKVTEKVDSIFNELLDPSMLKSIMATYDTKKKRLYVSYPLKAMNDRLLLLDFTSGAIHEWPIDNTTIYYDHDLKALLIGTDDGYIYQMEAQYPDEAAYNFRWKSKAYDFAQPKIYKNLGSVRLTLDTGDQEVTVSLWSDNQKINEVRVSAKDEWVEIPTKGGIRGFNYQVMIEGLISKPITISPPMVFKYEETDVKTSNVMRE